MKPIFLIIAVIIQVSNQDEIQVIKEVKDDVEDLEIHYLDLGPVSYDAQVLRGPGQFKKWWKVLIGEGAEDVAIDAVVELGFRFPLGSEFVDEIPILHDGSFLFGEVIGSSVSGEYKDGQAAVKHLMGGILFIWKDHRGRATYLMILDDSGSIIFFFNRPMTKKGNGGIFDVSGPTVIVLSPSTGLCGHYGRRNTCRYPRTKRSVIMKVRDRLGSLGHTSQSATEALHNLKLNDSSFYHHINCQGCVNVFESDRDDWIALDNFKGQNRSSSSIQLPFPILFFGREVEKIYVTNKGFISLGERLHDHIHMVQYIAPLGADFYVGDKSEIKVLNTTNEVIIEWRNVTLDGRSNGGFTFQVVISRNSTIGLVYKRLPENFLTLIKNSSLGPNAPVKAGMSDAVEADSALHTFNEVIVDLSHLKNGSIVRYVLNRPCNEFGNPHDCLEMPKCAWCSAIQSCGGNKHFPVNWKSGKCHEDNVTDTNKMLEEMLSKVQTTSYKVSLSQDFLLPTIRTSLSVNLNFTQRDSFNVELPFNFHFFNIMASKLVIKKTSEIVVRYRWVRNNWVGPYLALKIFPFPLPFRITNESSIHYFFMEMNKVLVIEWNDVQIIATDEVISFQLIINNDGKIHFVYVAVPDNLRYKVVKDRVGLFGLLDFQEMRVDVAKIFTWVRSGSAIIFDHKGSCEDQTQCQACLDFSRSCRWDNSDDACFNVNRPRDIVDEEFGIKDCYVKTTTEPPKETFEEEEEKEVEMEKKRDYYSFSFKNTSSKITELSQNGNIKRMKKITMDWAEFYDILVPFDFLFYGQVIRNLSISTNGFISIPSNKAIRSRKSQYIAPFKINMEVDPDDVESGVYAILEDGQFSVQWRRLRLKQTPEIRGITFQADLTSDGNIVIFYIQVPKSWKTLKPTIGLSDSFEMHNYQSPQYSTASTSLWRYHVLNVAEELPEDINNGIVTVTALETCHKFENCLTCTTQTSKFKCTWCERAGKCSVSNGLSRNYQSWINDLCHTRSSRIVHNRQCRPMIQISSHKFYNKTINFNSRSSSGKELEPGYGNYRISESGLFELPFFFPYYDSYFKLIDLNVDGMIKFDKTKFPTTTVAKLEAAIYVYRMGEEKPANLSSIRLRSYGTLGKDQMIIRWGDKYQLSLMKAGIIVMSYFGINDTEIEEQNDYHSVGLSFFKVFSKPKGLQLEHEVMWETRHIRNGLQIMFNPILEEKEKFVNANLDGYPYRLTEEELIKRVLYSLGITGGILASLGLLYYGWTRPTSYFGRFVVIFRMTLHRLTIGIWFRRYFGWTESLIMSLQTGWHKVKSGEDFGAAPPPLFEDDEENDDSRELVQT